MKQAYMYLRVSTQQQTEKFGIAVQQAEIENYCKENDIEIIGTYADEGITGKIVERDGLQAMLRDLEKNDIKNVICLNCSRLWRSDIAGGLIRFQLSKMECDIISVQEPTYSLYTTDPSDYLINSIMQALASYDRMQINQKLSAARKLKASKGQKSCGNCPYGYKYNESKEVVIDYNNNLVVQSIYTAYSHSKSYSQVKRMLDEKGLFTSTGKAFSVQAIKNIIANDFYTGIVTYAGKKSQGTHEPIISRELWDSCQ